MPLGTVDAPAAGKREDCDAAICGIRGVDEPRVADPVAPKPLQLSREGLDRISLRGSGLLGQFCKSAKNSAAKAGVDSFNVLEKLVREADGPAAAS